MDDKNLVDALTPWIKSNYNQFVEHGSGNHELFGHLMLANVLQAFIDGESLVDIYDWLESKPGQQFLKSSDMKPAGKYLNLSLSHLDDSYMNFDEPEYEEMVLTGCKKFIQDYFEEVRYRLIIK